jgi:hypothetical protein
MNVGGYGVIHQAVVFFDGGRPVKEMLQVEFEAILDQVVGLHEFAGRELCACFLRINQRLDIVGAVFFLVDFDERGYVNRSWNVPLQHLLDNAGRGPDLGSGRIRLACRSQCPVPWHARQLWDPELEGESNSLRQMQAAVRRNRLGLTVDVPELTAEDDEAPAVERVDARDSQRAQHRLQQEYEGRVGALEETHQLQLTATKAALQEQLDRVHQHYRTQVAQLRESLAAAKKLGKREHHRAQQLQEKLEQQLAEFQRAREASQHDAQERDEQRDQEQAQARQQFEVELRARVEQAGAELREMLEMREVELFYREEQLGTLRDEITRLRQERERLIGQGGGGILQRLAENGVTLVAYQPGAEVINVPVADVPRYLDSPQAFAAEKCSVSVEQYRLWLDHHELPVCGETLADGSVCGEPIEKIERPHRFIGGMHDRCEAHAAGGHVSMAVELDAR